jgi:hypothetical protein
MIRVAASCSPKIKMPHVDVGSPSGKWKIGILPVPADVHLARRFLCRCFPDMLEAYRPRPRQPGRLSSKQKCRVLQRQQTRRVSSVVSDLALTRFSLPLDRTGASDSAGPFLSGCEEPGQRWPRCVPICGWPGRCTTARNRWRSS